MNPRYFHSKIPPRKRFGQNFLQDKQVIADIVAAIAPKPEDNMIEIGPGLGALTLALLPKVLHLQAIEIDQDRAEELKRLVHAAGLNLGQTNLTQKLTLHVQDVLRFDFNQLKTNLKTNAKTGSSTDSSSKIRIVGNLPYNISTPLIFYLQNFSEIIQDMHFMLQKEVAERLVAGSTHHAGHDHENETQNSKHLKHSKHAYGRLSVMAQYFYHIEMLFDVKAEAFYPKPKVTSTFIRMIPKDKPTVLAENMALFREMVNAAFQHRRKTLENSLKQYLHKEDFESMGIDGKQRPEELRVDEFVIMSNFINTKLK